MFLVRPRPLPGESLSSWRQRSGLENGFRLFPRAPGELQRTDSDLKPSAGTVRWLAEENLLPEADVVQMTLSGLDGSVLRFRGGASVPRWVLPLRYSRRDRPFGIPFCPECLREDAVPYFRLRWRMCLHSVCARHGIRLVDACSRCGHPSWPATSALGNLYEGAWIPVHECPVCRFDLRCSPAEMNKFGSLPVSGEFFEHDTALSDGVIVPAVEFTTAAWCVAQLFVRNRSGTKIATANSTARELVAEISEAGERSIEWLPMATRARLTSQVAALFQNWPASLLAFSESNGLSAEHFSTDREDLPGWFESAIRIPLRKQVRGVTSADVRRAISQVASSGGALTKQAVAELLGSSGGRSLSEALGRRTQASSAELMLTLVALDTIVDADQRRRSSAEVRVRDALAILMAITLERDIESIVEMSIGEARDAIAECRKRALTGDVLDDLYGRLLRLSDQYVRCRTGLSRKRSPAAELFFVCFRGGYVQARGAQKLLRNCMSSVDPRLYRSVKVFRLSALLDA